MPGTIPAPEDWIESVSELRFPPSTNQRLQLLMDRNTEGLLTSEEMQELASLTDLSEELSLIRAQALHLLNRDPR
jgi:hypothetical protein